MSVSAQWTNDSAFNIDLGKQEAKQWIEAVCGEKFSNPDWQISLRDGRLLCKLINQIKPGSVKKINAQKTDFAEMENITFYLQAAKSLGLKDTQLFTSKELHEKDGRIRDVVISLYWLGRAARGIPTYKGPHLNLSAFQKMKCSKCKLAIDDNNYLATMDQQFHRKCASCCKCKNLLDPKETFYQLANDFYCPRCMIASSSVTDKTSSPHSHGHTHGKDGHNCGKCKKNLDSVDHVHGDDGKDYCVDCTCNSCHNPLKGNEKVKGGKKFCPDCICSECSDLFGPDGFYEKNGKNVCPTCFDKGNKGGSNKPATSSPGHHGGHHDHQHNKNPGVLSPAGKQSGGPADGCKACSKPIDAHKKSHPTGHSKDKYCKSCEDDYCCPVCNDEINGPAVSALGKKYHPNCFNCGSCKKNIPNNGGKFQKVNDEPWCNPCYDKKYGKNGFCSGCGGGIERSGVEALGTKWHPECFTCTNCHCTLKDSFEDVDGYPYCEKCAASVGGENCFACKKQLQGEVAEIFGKMWHKGCFKCVDCSKPFTTGYFPFDGIPYCEPCHLNRSANHCQSCSKPMVGAIIQAKGKQWHKSCFRCSSCNRSLSSTNDNPDVFIKFSRPFCRDCNPEGPAKISPVASPASSSPAVAKFCSKCGTKVGNGLGNSRMCTGCGSVF
eukprot:TRINITY_DN2291_c0_g2_i1.p1 TRINITY_DN2291_c0_g2~~TRINITY_DN2291_c0_g2_i1.p1  ORF type:complete len:663 (-),score=131.60 TRINITY_DN2291_c0_g2_i1:27-2015(-)